MKAYWKKLSAGERLRTQFVIGLLMLGLYGGLLYPFTYSELKETANMISRRQDRIAKRTKVETKDLSANPQAVRRKIEEVDQQLVKINESFNELDSGFAPIESSDARQHLLLEITTLARRTGMNLLAISRKGLSTEDGMVAAPLDPTLGRPLLILTANSQYQQLIAFIKGLKDLSFYVSVMNMKLYSRQLENKKGRYPVADGTIYVALEMSM